LSVEPAVASATPTFIFDVGGVVVRHDNGLLHDRLAAYCDDPIDARPRLADGVHDQVVGSGHLSIADLHRRLVEEFGFSARYDAFLAIWSSHFSEEPDMEPVIRTLARRHRTVFFSNTNAAHWAHVTAHYPALGHAHRAYLSHEMGLTKPDPASFLRVLELEGCRPADAVFIDDRADNVAAAAALGMDGIIFTDAAAFRTALAERNIVLAP
jgi:putative hydrolase of the HAD superfamily